MNECKQINCPFFNTESCIHADPGDCDLASFFPPTEKLNAPPAPLYVRFTYRDEWRHIPEEEVYPVWAISDFQIAVEIFRQRHESDGALEVFVTSDSVEWRVWGVIPAIMYSI